MLIQNVRIDVYNFIDDNKRQQHPHIDKGKLIFYKCLMPMTNFYMPIPHTCIDENKFVNGNKPNNLKPNLCTLGYTIFSSPITEITEIKMPTTTLHMSISEC